MIKTKLNVDALERVFVACAGKKVSFEEIRFLYLKEMNFAVKELHLPYGLSGDFEEITTVTSENTPTAKTTQGDLLEERSIVYVVVDENVDKIKKFFKEFKTEVKEMGKHSYEVYYDKLKQGLSFEAHKVPNQTVQFLKRKKFKNTCECCGHFVRNTRMIEFHHIKPVEYGGVDELDNFACVCRNCHAIIHSYGLEYEEQDEKRFDKKRDFFENVVKPTVKNAYERISEKKLKKFVASMLSYRYNGEDYDEEIA